jgi:rhodanese-related sulfurtransferase
MDHSSLLRTGRRITAAVATAAAVLSIAIVVAAAVPATARADDWADAQAAFDEYDDRRGLALLERAALGGDARAQLAWGLALRHGKRLFAGLAADPAAAKLWLDRAAAADHGARSADGVHARVPLSKRTKLGLYLRAADVPSFKQANARAVLFLDIRTRAEANYVGMPEAVDLLLPYMEHDEFAHEWDAARATFRPTANAGFADAVARAVAQRGLDRTAPIVLLCRSGDRSAKAADLLAGLGFRQVYSVVDGLEGDLAADGQRSVNGWKNARLPWSYRLDPAKIGHRVY